VLNLPLIGIWVQVLKVPCKILFPLILLFCLVGVYTVSNSIFDIYVMIAFGVVGYLMKKFEYEGAPLVLAFVLGPLMENNLRKALILSGRLRLLLHAAHLGGVPRPRRPPARVPCSRPSGRKRDQIAVEEVS
jgi:TctA family transporter